MSARPPNPSYRATPSAALALPADTNGVRARLWTAPFVRLLLVQTCFGLSFSVFFLLPKYLTETGASAGQIGLVMSLWGVAGVLVSPLIGTLLDRLGRKPFIVAGAALMAASAFGFVAADGYGPIAIGLRLAQGVAFALVFNAVMTMVADRAPRERMSQALGLAGTAALLTNAIAPAAVEPLAASKGWPVGFALAGVAGLVAVGVALAIREPPRPAATLGGDGWAALLRQPVAQAVAWSAITCGVGFGTLASFHQPFALSLGIERVGGFFVAYTVMAAGVRIGLGGFIDRLGARRMALASLALYALVVAAGAWLGFFGLVLIGGGLGLAHGTFFPAIAAHAMQGVDPAKRGRSMALLHASFNGGLGASVLVLGWVAERAGYPVIFLVAGAMVLTGVGVLARRGRPAPDTS
ncbi:MAG: MFS transporter [Myxococcota bacterium]